MHIKQAELINNVINDSINQSIKQWMDQLINQSKEMCDKYYI